MLRKIKLYGPLAKFLGKRVLKADVSSAAEAVQFLIVNWPELEKHMYDQYYKVQVAAIDLHAKELHYPAGSDDIKIIPCVAGAGGGWGKVIAGAALVGLAFATGGASLTYATIPMANAGAVTGLAFTGIWAKAAVYLGAALVLGGVSDLLTPTPKTPEFEEDVQNSFYFSGIVNSARPGTPVPVCYGEVLTGSTTISSSVDVNQVEV
jgi:predicted phage tail protein